MFNTKKAVAITALLSLALILPAVPAQGSTIFQSFKIKRATVKPVNRNKVTTTATKPPEKTEPAPNAPPKETQQENTQTQQTTNTGLDTEEQAFLTILNKYRKDNGIGELKASTTLNSASDWMSNDLANTYANRRSLSHTDSLGRNPFVRMSDLGYNYRTAMAENIAAGSITGQGVFTMWKNSPGHNTNMLNGSYKVIGIARVNNPSSIFKWYWTTNFGGYDDTK